MEETIYAEEAVSYRHANGEVRTAESYQKAAEICPVLGGMVVKGELPQEDIDLLAELTALGNSQLSTTLELSTAKEIQVITRAETSDQYEGEAELSIEPMLYDESEISGAGDFTVTKNKNDDGTLRQQKTEGLSPRAPLPTSEIITNNFIPEQAEAGIMNSNKYKKIVEPPTTTSSENYLALKEVVRPNIAPSRILDSQNNTYQESIIQEIPVAPAFETPTLNTKLVIPSELIEETSHTKIEVKLQPENKIEPPVFQMRPWETIQQESLKQEASGFDSLEIPVISADSYISETPVEMDVVEEPADTEGDIESALHQFDDDQIELPIDEPVEQSKLVFNDLESQQLENDIPVSEVISVLADLAEVIDELEEDNTINALLDEIMEITVEVPDELRGEIEIELDEINQEKVINLFEQLFQAAGIELAPEIIKAFAILSLKNKTTETINEIEESDENQTFDNGTHELLNHILKTARKLRLSIVQMYLLGRSAIGLYRLVPA